MDTNINKIIYNTSLKTSNDFLFSYLENEEKIIESFKNFNGIKTELYLKEINKELDDLIKFSSIFSDLTVLNNTSSPSKQSHLTYFDSDHKYFKERQFQFQSNDLNNLNHSFYDFTPVYIHRSDNELKQISNKFSTLINSNKLLVRPLRGIYAKNKLNEKNTLHYVNPNTKDDLWIVNNVNTNDIFLDNGLQLPQVKKMFELTLPYFKDINFQNLTKVLDDESDSLSTFRSLLKSVIRESENNLTSIEEIRQDILSPQIDTLNRKFRTLSNKHKLSTVGLVGTFTLTLLISTYSSSDLARIISYFASSLPLGGFIQSENNYQENLSNLKDNNYFLLWKISKG